MNSNKERRMADMEVNTDNSDNSMLQEIARLESWLLENQEKDGNGAKVDH